MKKWLSLLFLLFPALTSAQLYPNSFQAFCEQGGTKAQVQGLSSTNLLQGSFPGCLVTVYNHGTLNIATIYADSSGTPLGNPFTSTTPNGSFQFNAAVGAYDVQTSGAGITTPYVYSNVIFPLNPVGVFVPIAGNTTMTGPLISPAFNGEFNVLQYGSGDLGAHITAADAALGTNCGTLEVPPNQVGLTVTTAPTISSCHTLWVRSPVTWAVGSAPILASHTAIRGDGPGALQTVPANPFINAQNINHILIDNLWITDPNPSPGNNNNVFFHCQTCSEIAFTHNHLNAEAGIWMDSTATSYAGVNSSNLSFDVQISDNYLNGEGEVLDLALLQYTQHVTESNNQTHNAQYGTQWWGGDASANGAPTNTRWAQDISIVNSVDTNVTAAEWGSMGQDVTVNGVTADTCTDVCFDTEGGFRITFENFTVHNAINGSISTFYFSRHVSFGPGVVTTDSASTMLPFFLHNSSQDPTGSYDVSVNDVQFNCADPVNVCQGIIDPIGGLRFEHNSFYNTVVNTAVTNNSGFDFDNNRFAFTLPIGILGDAIRVLGIIGTYSNTNGIKGNVFSSTVTQASGIHAINIVNNDPNADDTTVVSDNQTSGFTTDAIFIAASGNAGILPIFVFHGNRWGSNFVQNITSGAQGAFWGDQWLDNHATFGELTLTTLPSQPCLGTNPSGDFIAGTCGSSNATAIQTVPVSAASPSTNQVLAFVGGQYVPTTLATGGVTQINGVAGAYTFSGAGVSCTSTTCTFSGSGTGIGSITWALPAWLQASPTTISSSGTQTFASATGLTSHEVVGTCGTATTVSLCALVAGDIPTLNQNTTGTAANLSGTPALPNGTTATTQTVGDNTTDIATDAFVIANSGTVNWPTTNDLVVSNSTNTPAGLAPSINGDCVVVLGGVFTLGACNSGGVGVTSLNGQTGVVLMTLGTQGNSLTGASGKVNIPTAFLQVDAVNDLGLDNTGSTSVTSALNSYLLSPPTNGVKIVFPCGKYYYATQLTISATSSTKENIYFYGTVPATLYGTSCVQFIGATSGVTGTDIIEYNNTSAGAGQQLGPMFENLQFVDRSGGTMRSGLHIIQANSTIVNHVYTQNITGHQYTTGTASVNNGSTSVTCAGGCSWSSSFFQPDTLFCSNGHCQEITYTSSTSGTLVSAWQFANVSSASYSLDYNGIGILIDGGTAVSGTNFAQYENGWYDIGGFNDRIVIGTHGSNSSSYGVSRFTIVGGRTNCEENQDSMVSFWGGFTDTMELIGMAENNCTWFSLSESAHANTWIGNHGENGGSYAPNTTCGGSPSQACTRGIELNSDNTAKGWGNTIIGNYLYKCGNCIQVDSDNVLRTIISDNPLPSGVNTNNYVFLTSGNGKTTATVHQWDMWLDPNGFTGTKTAGSCTLTLTGGLVTNVTGC